VLALLLSGGEKGRGGWVYLEGGEKRGRGSRRVAAEEAFRRAAAADRGRRRAPRREEVPITAG
jgi:hypothetical protein